MANVTIHYRDALGATQTSIHSDVQVRVDRDWCYLQSQSAGVEHQFAPHQWIKVEDRDTGNVLAINPSAS